MMTQAAGWGQATSSARVATKRHIDTLSQESVAVKGGARGSSRAGNSIYLAGTGF